MTDPKPLPCPYCGSDQIVRHCVLRAFISCQGCDARGPGKNGFPKAIEAWNTVAKAVQHVANLNRLTHPCSDGHWWVKGSSQCMRCDEEATPVTFHAKIKDLA